MLERWRWALLAAAVVWGGCFPSPIKRADVTTGDVDAASGEDTSTAGDTRSEQDTTAADTSAPDTSTADTTPTDTRPPECTTPADCVHLAGTCTRVVCLGGTCAAQPDTGASCDDGNPCTKADVCSGFSCAGAAYSCDDGESCTADACDGSGGCNYPAMLDFCWIAGACYVAGDSKPGDQCRICESGESWSPNDGAPCDDGDAQCTLGDTCDGTTCVGGPPPDDTAGDWATNVVLSTSPQRSVVQAVAATGIADWTFFAHLTGGGVIPTTSGDVPLIGAAIAVVRKGPTSTWVHSSFVASQESELLSTASGDGTLAWAVRLKGVGTAQVGDTAITQDQAVDERNYVVSTDLLGGVRFLRVAFGGPRALARLPDGQTIQAGGASGLGYLDQHGVLTPIGHDDEVLDVTVVAYDSLGTPTWGGLVRTPGFSPGTPSLCAVSGQDVAMATAFRGSASVELGSEPVTVTSSSTHTNFLIARFDGVSTTTAFAPFTFTSEIQGSVLAPSPRLLCDPDGLTVIFGTGGFGSVAAPGSAPVTLGTDSGSVIRLDWDGNLVWSRNLTGMVAAAGRPENLVLSSLTGTLTAFSLSDPLGGVLRQVDALSPLTVLELGSDGSLLWARDSAADVPLIVSCAAARTRNGHEAVAVGGAFIGGAVDLSSLTNPATLDGASDINGLVFLMNSAGALSCSGP